MARKLLPLWLRLSLMHEMKLGVAFQGMALKGEAKSIKTIGHIVNEES